MDTALLHESMLRTSYHGLRAQMLILLLTGFGLGILLLSPLPFERYFMVQEPAMNMPLSSKNQMEGAVGRTRAYAAPAWRDGIVNHQRLLLPKRSRLSNNMAPAKAIPTVIGGSPYAGTWGIHAGPMVVRATPDSEAVQRLKKAITVAEECIGECVVEWDNVEELSAVVADQARSGSSTPEKEVPISSDFVNIMKSSREQLEKAREVLGKQSAPDEKVFEEVGSQIVDAAKGFKEVGKAVSTEKGKRLSDALQEAISAAKACVGAECAVAWDTVEELSAAMADDNAADLSVR